MPSRVNTESKADINYHSLYTKPSLTEWASGESTKWLRSWHGLFLIATIIVPIVVVLARGGLTQILGGLLVIGVLLLLIGAWAFTQSSRSDRLQAFAAANDMDYVATMKDSRPGMIFGQGRGGQFTDVLISKAHSFDEIGNYSFITGSGNNTVIHKYGYARIKLPRKLPHMVLDGKKSNFFGGRLSNLPTAFTKDQRISLEGDFDKHFTLYAPVKYKTDAFYVFTPNVMQAFFEQGFF